MANNRFSSFFTLDRTTDKVGGLCRKTFSYEVPLGPIFLVEIAVNTIGSCTFNTQPGLQDSMGFYEILRDSTGFRTSVQRA